MILLQLAGLDGSILQVLIDTLVNAHIGTEAPQNQNKCQSARTMEDITADTVPKHSTDSVLCDPIPYNDSNVKDPVLCLIPQSGVQVSSQAATAITLGPQSGLLEVVEEPYAPETAVPHRTADVGKSCSLYDTLSAAHHPPSPRTPLRIRPQTACASSQTFQNALSPTAMIASTEVQGVHTAEKSCGVRGSSSSREAAPSRVMDTVGQNKLKTSISDSTLSRGVTASDHSICESEKVEVEETGVCEIKDTNLSPSLEHGVFDTPEAILCKDNTFYHPTQPLRLSGQTQGSPPILSLGLSSGSSAIDIVCDDTKNQDVKVGLTYLPPAPPPGKDIRQCTKVLYILALISF